jgi:hypothetical protein
MDTVPGTPLPKGTATLQDLLASCSSEDDSPMYNPIHLDPTDPDGIEYKLSGSDSDSEEETTEVSTISINSATPSTSTYTNVPVTGLAVHQTRPRLVKRPRLVEHIPRGNFIRKSSLTF